MSTCKVYNTDSDASMPSACTVRLTLLTLHRNLVPSPGSPPQGQTATRCQLRPSVCCMAHRRRRRLDCSQHRRAAVIMRTRPSSRSSCGTATSACAWFYVVCFCGLGPAAALLMAPSSSYNGLACESPHHGLRFVCPVGKRHVESGSSEHPVRRLRSHGMKGLCELLRPQQTLP